MITAASMGPLPFFRSDVVDFARYRTSLMRGAHRAAFNARADYI